MLAGRLLSHDEAGEERARWGFAGLWNRGFARLERGYRRVLSWSLGHRQPVLAAAAASLLVGVFPVASGGVPTEFFPPDDQGIFQVRTGMPSGTSLERHDALMRQIEERLSTLPEAVTAAATIGAGGGNICAGAGAGQASAER